MVQASRTFRVFVSPTFSDLKAERNALQERVFPRLQALDAMPGDGGSGSGIRLPLIVTAVDSGAGFSVYCPVYNKTSSLRKESLDTEITCLQQGCDTQLKINLFVIKRA